MWNEISELPVEQINKIIMVLDGEEDICTECTDETDNKRWFYGENMGAYPIDEIQFWKVI